MDGVSYAPRYVGDDYMQEANTPEITPTVRHEVMDRHRPYADMTAAAVWDVEQELTKALRKFGKLGSAHEGYAVILEELDELWDHVKLKREVRDQAAMRKEAMQVAAMAVRFMLDCC